MIEVNLINGYYGLETELQHELGILVIIALAIIITIIVLTIIKFIKDKKDYGVEIEKV